MPFPTHAKQEHASTSVSSDSLPHGERWYRFGGVWCGCSWAHDDLCTAADNQTAMARQGGLEMLITLLATPNEPTQRQAAKALANLGVNGPCGFCCWLLLVAGCLYLLFMFITVVL
jgi:hypothetical protein